MGPIGKKAIGIGMELASNMFGGMFQRGSNKKNMKRQYNYQRMLNQQGHDLQFDMWNKTNYPAQLEMMKKAGLNPGLMYGLGGGSGTTTGSQGGGSATGGQAPMQPMGIDAGTASQIELNKALANKANAEATKTSGVDTELGQASINKMIEETTNLGVKRDLMELEKISLGFDNDLKEGTLQINLKKAGEELEKLKLENEFTRASWGDALAQVANNAILAEAQAKYKQDLNEREARLIEFTIKKICNDMEVDIQNANENTIKNEITEELGKLQIDRNRKNAWINFASSVFGSIMGVAGKAVPTKTTVTKN